MRKATVFHLRLSEDIPIQKETLSIIRSIPKGQRTLAICQMIVQAQKEANLKRLISEAVQTAIQENISHLTIQATPLEIPNTAPQGEEITDDILSFLSALQKEEDA